jgi:hypothetical protein
MQLDVAKAALAAKADPQEIEFLKDHIAGLSRNMQKMEEELKDARLALAAKSEDWYEAEQKRKKLESDFKTTLQEKTEAILRANQLDEKLTSVATDAAAREQAERELRIAESQAAARFQQRLSESSRLRQRLLDGCTISAEQAKLHPAASLFPDGTVLTLSGNQSVEALVSSSDSELSRDFKTMLSSSSSTNGKGHAVSAALAVGVFVKGTTGASMSSSDSQSQGFSESWQEGSRVLSVREGTEGYDIAFSSRLDLTVRRAASAPIACLSPACNLTIDFNLASTIHHGDTNLFWYNNTLFFIPSSARATIATWLNSLLVDGTAIPYDAVPGAIPDYSQLHDLALVAEELSMEQWALKMSAAKKHADLVSSLKAEVSSLSDSLATSRRLAVEANDNSHRRFEEAAQRYNQDRQELAAAVAALKQADADRFNEGRASRDVDISRLEEELRAARRKLEQVDGIRHRLIWQCLQNDDDIFFAFQELERVFYDGSYFDASFQNGTLGRLRSLQQSSSPHTINSVKRLLYSLADSVQREDTDAALGFIERISNVLDGDS